MVVWTDERKRKLVEKMKKIDTRKKMLLLFGTIILIGLAGIIIHYTDNSNSKYDNNSSNISNVDNNSYHNETDKNIKEIGSWTYDNNIRIANQTRSLHNNVWGATHNEQEDYDTKSYIYYKSDGSFGWEWHRQNPKIGDGNKFIEPIYPEVVVGSIPGKADYTTDRFPIRYGNISNWTSEINYRWIYAPTDYYNLAYDIYFLDPAGGNKKFNVMFWIEGHNDEESIGIVSDGINDYKHFKRTIGDGQSWEWHGFELINQSDVNKSSIHYKVDIKKLLENVLPNVMQDDWLVPGVELGSEVWEGSGRIEIDKYVITINNRDV